MRISDWSSDVCSSDLRFVWVVALANFLVGALILLLYSVVARRRLERQMAHQKALVTEKLEAVGMMTSSVAHDFSNLLARSEEHTSELQSLMRISYAVFCLKKKII